MLNLHGVDVIWEDHLLRGGAASGVSREGIRRLVSHPGDVDEPILEGFFLQIPEPGIAYVVKGAVPEDLEEGTMISGDGETFAAQHEVFGFLQGIGHCQCFSLYGGIARLDRVGEA